ncbi:MAG: hypothetical protein WCD37_17810 [Chloroflexia bacterium]
MRNAKEDPHSAFRIPHSLWVVLAYAVLTIVMTWPITANLTTQVPGGGDAWQHIWNLWWAKVSLLDLTNPYHTDLLYYPQGVNLYFHTLVLSAGLIGIPLQLAGLNLITTYNLVLLSTYVLAGWGAFLLCRYLTRNDWAAFVGGLVFAFAPYHSAHLFGHMNLASLQWIPFYVLFLLKTVDGVDEGRRTKDEGREIDAGDVADRRQRLEGNHVSRITYHVSRSIRNLKSAIIAGVFLALNAYTEWTYAIFLVLLTGLLVAWKLFIPSERRELRDKGIGLVGLGARVMVIGVVFLVLTAPIFFPTLAEARQGYAQQPPEETLFYSADLVNAFLPSELHPVWGKAIADRVQNIPPYMPLKNPSERVLFLGYTVLAISAWGLWRLRRDRRVLFWSLTAALMWLLSLGPVLQVLGRKEFTAFGVEIPLPYLLLYKLPLFSIMRTPARLTVLVMLALAILVAFAVAALMAGRRTKDEGRTTEEITNYELRITNDNSDNKLQSGYPLDDRNPKSKIQNPKSVLALLLPILILFEFMPVFPTVPPGWNVPIYARIAGEPGTFALLELPIRPFGDYMAYQTIHGKPIIGGYLSRQPPYPLLDENPALHYLLDNTPPDDPIASQVRGGAGVQSLRELGVKYVIIRWWAFTPEQKAAMQAKLSTLLARPPDLSYPGDQVDAWQLLP